MIDAHTAGRTFDCRKANCVNEARTNRGVYAYLCDEHAEQKRLEIGAATPLNPAPERPAASAPAASEPQRNGHVPSLASELRTLNALAVKVDRLRAKQAKLTQVALAAKAEADTAEAAYRAALRDATGRRT